VRIAFYLSETDNTPKCADLDWPKLVEILTFHKETPCAPCSGHDCRAKFGRAWSPVNIGSRRSNGHVSEVTALVLDFDGVTRPQAIDIATRIKPFTHIAYSTHSHRPDLDRYAFRVAIQLTRPVPAPQWRTVLATVVQVMGLPADPSCKDLSRLYFLPTHPAGASHFAAAHEGRPLDVDGVLRIAPQVAAPIPVQPAPTAQQVDVAVDLDDIRKRLAGVTKSDSKELASVILAGHPVGYSPAQRAHYPQLRTAPGRDAGLQRAASLVAWASPRGTPVAALMEILRPSLAAMHCEPEGIDHWRNELQDMCTRAVQRKEGQLQREDQEHAALLQTFDFTPSPQAGQPAQAVNAHVPPSATSTVPASAGPALSSEASSLPPSTGDLLTDLTNMKHDPPPKKGPAGNTSWTQALVWTFNKDGDPVRLKNCAANIHTSLLHDVVWKGVLRRNLYTGETEVHGGPVVDGVAILTDELVTEIGMWFAKRPDENLRVEVGTSVLYEAIQSVAVKNAYDPVRDYLDALKWDGVPRLATWLETYLGAKTTSEVGDDITPYLRTVGKRWLLAAVARTYSPGCKVDNVLILEGPQDLQKSSALRVLASREFFTDTSIDIQNKDACQVTTRTWICELAELDSLRRSENSAQKAFFTRDWEHYRPPYGRVLTKVPRRCVFAGSVNPEGEYLTDTTGNRRYWPVTCGNVDLLALTQDRDQLWAEAVEVYKQGETCLDCAETGKIHGCEAHRWWLEKSESKQAAEVAEERTTGDEWDGVILRWWAQVAQRPQEVSMESVLEAAIGVPKERFNTAMRVRAGVSLRRLGFLKRRRREGGRLVWFYVPGHMLENIQTQPTQGPADHLKLVLPSAT
jgi:predicted P-loop ATPase